MKNIFRQQSLWFSVLSVTASALNFLFYPVLAHSLDLASFGDVQVGVSFVMQAAALFTSLNLVALFLSAHKSTSIELVTRLERIIISISIIAAVIVAVCVAPLSRTLQLHDASLLYLLAIIFVFNVPAGTWIGTLQGEGKFIQSGLIAVTASLTKIILAILLISLGFGAHGAMLGILIGTIVFIPLVYLAHSSKRLNIINTFRPARLSDFRALLASKPTLYTLVAFFFLALLSTFDIIAAKVLLSPTQAGIYAQLSTVAKIPYFALIPLATIGFERFIKKATHEGRFMLLFCGLLAAASSVLLLAEPFVLRVFFRLDTVQYSQLAALFLVVAFTAYTLSTIVTYSLISRGSLKKALIPLLCGFVLTPILLAFGSSLEGIALNYMLSQIALLVILVILRYNKAS